MLLGYTVAKACASPRTFDLVHQTVSPGDKLPSDLNLFKMAR